MSKASQWAREREQTRAAMDNVQRERPESFTLVLNLKDRICLSVEDSGKPRVTTPEARIGYDMEIEPLLDMARWIQDTFGPGR